ncbi:sugar ABC transporter permease [Glycomyces sp. TRM65418]|uniref:multiple monosaccharide ABC transporter permease n=1 Tax=Glycomyces sp. TRM65418 TaxID=2867006 RepID=UPI001CE5F063|nr:multiple monosaccharide ABC transporter permease [Glycomyces sp. TRM65418]MCC3765727.1 sugar ABC transporter permease [Glycomyces sp. TRM65418]QZD55319.1 sugar ABC transporter permease [Glycomyces sp. TRM65418]
MSTVQTTSRPNPFSALKHLNLRSYGMIIALVLIMLLFQVLNVTLQNENFITPLNLTNVILQNSYILILAIGMMLVIVNGHIDLSVGSLLAFCGAVSAIALSHWDLPWFLAVLIAIALGALVGVWQGFWIAYVRIPAFIVTLAGMLIFRGLTLKVLDAETIGTRGTYNQLASGYDVLGVDLRMPTLVVGIAGAALYVLLQVRGRNRQLKAGIAGSSQFAWLAKVVAVAAVIVVASYVFYSYKGLPIIGWILLGLVLLYTFIANRTVFGRHVYAGGGNEKAALLSGVKTKKTTFWVFVNMGALSGLAGVIVTARLHAATPGAGEMFELNAIASSFIGGASVTGGVGTIIGAVIGGLVMGVLNQGMQVLGIATDTVQIVLGLVVLAAVLFDVWNKKRATGGGLMPPIVGTTPGGSGEAKSKGKEGSGKEPAKAGSS